MAFGNITSCGYLTAVRLTKVTAVSVRLAKVTTIHLMHNTQAYGRKVGALSALDACMGRSKEDERLDCTVSLLKLLEPVAFVNELHGRGYLP